MYRIIIYYLATINVVAFVTYGVDKYKAIKGMWRIPEITLIGLAAAFGAIGSYAGMVIWRHKTRHRLFFIGVPSLFIAQLFLLCYLVEKDYI